MNMIDSYEITSVKEYIDYVEGLPSEFSLARGQFRDYPLYPGIYRKDSQNMALYSEADKIRFMLRNTYMISILIMRMNCWSVRNILVSILVC